MPGLESFQFEYVLLELALTSNSTRRSFSMQSANYLNAQTFITSISRCQCKREAKEGFGHASNGGALEIISGMDFLAYLD